MGKKGAKRVESGRQIPRSRRCAGQSLWAKRKPKHIALGIRDRKVETSVRTSAATDSLLRNKTMQLKF